MSIPAANLQAASLPVAGFMPITAALTFSPGEILDATPGNLTMASDAASNECEMLTNDVMQAQYPSPPKLPFFHKSTTSGFLQKVRQVLLLWKDKRTLDHPRINAMTRHSALGPLDKAVERAVVRRQKENSPAKILAIGAGQRLMEAQLKELFGNRIEIHEVSPSYAELKSAVDVELPISGIDDAELPKDYFDLIYSFYGNIYGRDQIHILQKVIDSLAIGGEAFLMWKITSIKNYRIANLMRRHTAFFQQRGIDVSVESKVYGEGPSLEIFHTVWVRKRANNVNIKALLEETRGLVAEDAKELEAKKTVRFSLNGPYFYSRDISQRHLECLVERMIASAAKAMNIGSEDLAAKLLHRSYLAHEFRSRSHQLATEFLQTYYYDDVKSGTPNGLEYSVPLSVLLLNFIHRAIPVLKTKTTLAQYQAMIAAARYSR